MAISGPNLTIPGYSNAISGSNTITLTTSPTTYSTTGYTTISSGSSYNWTQPPTNFYSSNQKTVMSIPHGEEKMVLEKEATLEVKGNVVINGLDLEERLKIIEKVLCIPQRDVTMEAKYPKLKGLYEQYMHELERYKTWDRVKGNENDSTT